MILPCHSLSERTEQGYLTMSSEIVSQGAESVTDLAHPSHVLTSPRRSAAPVQSDKMVSRQDPWVLPSQGASGRPQVLTTGNGASYGKEQKRGRGDEEGGNATGVH